jgi:branched-chain amino acid transport system permease protein
LDILIQQLINGVIQGAGYAIIAAGLTLIFGVLRVLNFAHGEFYMVGAFLTYTLMIKMGMDYFSAMFFSFIGIGLIGAFTEKIILKPLIERNDLSSILATIALMIILENLAMMIWGAAPNVIPSPFSNELVTVGFIRLTMQSIVTVFGAGVIFFALFLILQKTKFGLFVRATAQNKLAASAVGINQQRIHTLTFGLACGLASLAGSLVCASVSVFPTVGQLSIIKAFVVVILGGLGSIAGAIFGGLLIGIVEVLASGYISVAYKDVVGFSLVVVILLLKPSGLFGLAE